MSDRPTLLLEHHLKELKLPTFLGEYGKIAAQCASEGVDYPDYLLRLSELELIDRHHRLVARRIKAARFPAVKSLDAFDFPAIPSVNRQLVTQLARCEYIERRENVIAIGNSGTGKTHIALGLGLAACQKGLTVGFTTASALVNELMEARDEMRLLNLQKRLARLKLLIIDELGFVPLSRTGAELLFEVFSQRYERGSVLDPRDHQPAVRRVDRDVRVREVDRRSAGQAHTPRPHHRNERRQLPSQTERQTCFRITFEPPLNTSAPDIFPQQLARTFMLNNGAKWYNFSPPRWSFIAPPLTEYAALRRFCRDGVLDSELKTAIQARSV